jgi:hypothetical protein
MEQESKSALVAQDARKAKGKQCAEEELDM